MNKLNKMTKSGMVYYNDYGDNKEKEKIVLMA